MESRENIDEIFKKCEQTTKKYRDNYYKAFKAKYKRAKNYADLDIRKNEFTLDKDNSESMARVKLEIEKKSKFGNWSYYNCKAGRVIVKQLRLVECTITETCLDAEDLDSSDDSWRTDSSDDECKSDLCEELSDDELEDLGSSFPEKQSKNKGKNSKNYELSLSRNFAAVSLNEKTGIYPLSRRRTQPIPLDGNKTVGLLNNERTQFPTLKVKQVSTVQAEVMTDNAKKGPLSVGKKVHKKKETLISLEIQKKYLKCDSVKESFVKLTRFSEVSTSAGSRTLGKNCFVDLTRFNECLTYAECQPLNSEICSKKRETKKPNKRVIQSSCEEFNDEDKSRGKDFVKGCKSSVRYCKSVYNVKSLIQDGQFSPSRNLGSSLDHSFLEASFNENYDISNFVQKGKRKSKTTEFDEALPSPKRSSNVASNSIAFTANALGNFYALEYLHLQERDSSNLNAQKDKMDAKKRFSCLFGEP